MALPLNLNLNSLPRNIIQVLLICLALPSPWMHPVSASLTGDTWCGVLMCTKATVNGSIVTYELQSLNQLGWMSIGFGSQMKNTPLVILWPNADGTVTLSQRQAAGHVEPTPLASPPRVAQLSPRTNLSDITPTLAFDIPKNNDTVQQLIWAFGVTRPPPDPSTSLEQHLDAGAFTLDLTKPLNLSTTTPAGSTPSQPPASIPTSSPTITPQAASPTAPSLGNASHHSHDPFLAAHAILSFIGFMVLLPLSALVARWGRTRTPLWLKSHWFVSVVLSMPVITVGWVLGPLSVSKRGRKHVVNEHQIMGVVLFALYILQLTSGVVILRRAKQISLHPPRNIIHIVLGLVMLVLAFAETKTGISRDTLLSPSAAKILTWIWVAWAIIIPTGYLVGLKDLRRQRDQERLGWLLPTPPFPVAASLPLAAHTSDRNPHEESIPSVAADDDGTHDMFSRPRDFAADPNVTEMREVVWERTMPISIPVPLSSRTL